MRGAQGRGTPGRWPAARGTPGRWPAAGAQVILMASRALAAAARGPRDYLEVYGELLKQADRPVILHWLGEAFDPALRGYWGGTSFDAAARTVLELIERAGDRVDGIKLSVLDAGHEVALRRRLWPPWTRATWRATTRPWRRRSRSAG